MSPAQLEMLRTLAAGDELWTLNAGARCRAFWHSSMATANVNTFRALYRMGHLSALSANWRGARYTISDNGRAALKEEER